MNGYTDINITENDYVCTACYNHHLRIAQDAESTSTNEELKQLLSSPRSPAQWGESCTPHITVAMNGIITRLGDVLLKKLAVLFPDVYRCFLQLVMQEANAASTSLSESQIGDIVPKIIFLRVHN
jgi:hypothetical protein